MPPHRQPAAAIKIERSIVRNPSLVSTIRILSRDAAESIADLIPKAKAFRLDVHDIQPKEARGRQASLKSAFGNG